jgi:Ca2+-binding RTX toxin-like protein
MKARKSFRPLSVQLLESRELMAGVIGLNAGTLTILGTAANDSVVVSQVGAAVQVSMTHLGHTHTQQFPAAAVSQIYFRGYAGDDYFANNTNIRSTAYGDAGSDTLIGGFNNDVLIGGYGNDRLYGRAGNDTMYGQDGDDLMYGGAGNDYMYGQNGNDRIFGEAGNDYIRGGYGHDLIRGGLGNDLLYGDAGNDQLFGDAGSDRLLGGDGNDRLDGGYDGAVDYLWGNLGADTFIQHRKGIFFTPEDSLMDVTPAQGDTVINVFHP